MALAVQRRVGWVCVAVGMMLAVSKSPSGGFAVVRESKAPKSLKGLEPCKILLIGNPGIGKSAILNGMIGYKCFESGVSFGSGMTYELDIAKIGKYIFMDTPGLADTNLREKAAKAITEALKQCGRYKIIFVIGLDSGRLRPEDVTVMRLVIESADIDKYGVIINKLEQKTYEKLSDPSHPAKQQVLGMIQAGLSKGQEMTDHIYLMPHDEELAGEDNKVKQPPKDFFDFLKTMPDYNLLKPELVKPIKNNFVREVVTTETWWQKMLSNVASNVKVSVSIRIGGDSPF